jgi:peroxiredoxin
MSLAQELQARSAAARRSLAVEHIPIFDLGIEWLRSSGAISAALRAGEVMPDFALPDVLGGTVSADGLLDRGPAVLTFFCGSWCSLCAATLLAYGRIAPQVVETGGRLAAVTMERPDATRTFADAAALGYPLLSDADGRVCKLFGLLYALPAPLVRVHRELGIDLPHRNANGRWELPLAATYVVSSDGMVDFAVVDADHARRAEPDDVLVAVARLAQASPPPSKAS